MTTWLDFVVFNVAGSAFLALVALWVSRRMRRPALAHTLWLVVLLKLVTPPLVPIAGFPRISALAARHAGDLGVPARSQTGSLPVASIPSEPANLEVASAPVQSEGLAQPAIRRAAIVNILFGLSLAGTALLSSLTLVRGLRFQRRLRREPRAPAALQARAQQLARQLGVARLPMIRVVSQPIGPSLWPRLWSCEVLLPAHLLPRLTPDERDMLLAHELAHVRRRDHWIRPVEQLIVALYWWNPVAWWARRHLRAEEEKCCDALVLDRRPQQARAYAEGLLKTIEFLAPKRQAVPALAMGAGSAMRMEERMKAILSATARRPTSRRMRALFVVPAVLILLAAPAWVQDSAGVGKPQTEEKQAAMKVHREELRLQQELRELEARHMQIRMQIDEAMQERERLRMLEQVKRLEEKGQQEEAQALRQRIAQLEREAAFRREQVQFEIEYGQRREALEFQLQELSLQREELLLNHDEEKAQELLQQARKIELQIRQLELEAMRSELERTRKRLRLSEQELEELSKP